MGYGVHTTGQSRFLPLGLPIDQALVSKGVRVTGRHVGDDIGSDHFSVVIDLAF